MFDGNPIQVRRHLISNVLVITPDIVTTISHYYIILPFDLYTFYDPRIGVRFYLSVLSTMQ